MPYPAGMAAARRPLRALSAAAFCGAAVSLSVSAGAQPAALREVPLVVQRAPAASGCSDANALAERVNTLVGRKALVAAADSGSGFAFDVQILKSEEGFTAIVLAAGRSRQLEDPGPTCGSLSEALAATLAILVDADDTPPPSAPPPPPPRPAPAPVIVPPPTRPPPPPSYGPRFLVSPIVAVSSGLSGVAVPALALAADVRVYGPFSVLAGFTWTPSQSYELAPGHVDVQLLFGQLGACASTWRLFGSSRLGGCFQVNVGGIGGKGVGYLTTKEVVRPWTSFALTAMLDVPIVDRFFWSSRLSGFVVVPQEGFQVDNVGVAFDPPPVALLAGTGVGVRFY
jgi:hypothetical protein